MTAKELDQKIRTIAPRWMVDEADSLIDLARSEDWEDAPETIMECWDRWDGQDWTNTRQYKRAMTKIERAIGMQRQLGPGEMCLTVGARGYRNYHEGDWVFDKSWEELLINNEAA